MEIKTWKNRHKGTRLTEFFSTKFTGFNKTTGNGLSFLSGKMVKRLQRTNNMECTEID